MPKPGRFSNLSDEELRHIKQISADESEAYANDPDKDDPADVDDFEQAGDNYAEADAELRRRGKL